MMKAYRVNPNGQLSGLEYELYIATVSAARSILSLDDGRRGGADAKLKRKRRAENKRREATPSPHGARQAGNSPPRDRRAAYEMCAENGWTVGSVLECPRRWSDRMEVVSLSQWGVKLRRVPSGGFRLSHSEFECKTLPRDAREVSDDG